MTDHREPIVLRSLRALDALPETTLPIEQLGTTYTMCQDVSWLDQDHFVVGRWDGTLSIFNKTTSPDAGAVITTAVSAPADAGVQMVEWIAPRTFISSNDASSMVVWQALSGDFESVRVIQTLDYASSFGVANSAEALTFGNRLMIVTGHEAGYVLIWTGNADGSSIQMVTAIDLTSPNPVNPWGLQNIRGISTIIDDSDHWYVATGSENGEICILEVLSATVMSRTVFNPNAQRGINAVAAFGQNLLVANCSVGPQDRNLWYYWINSSDWSVTLQQSVNLIVDTSRAQVFNFDVVWGMSQNHVVFYSATEEGVLWMGNVLGGTGGNKLSVIGYQKVAVADLGAALAAGLQNLAYVAYNVSGFNTNVVTADLGGRNPNKVRPQDATG